MSHKVNPRFYTLGLYEIPELARLSGVPDEMLQHAIREGHLETIVVKGTVKASVRALWRCMGGAKAATTLQPSANDEEEWGDLGVDDDENERAGLEELDVYVGAADDEEEDVWFSAENDDEYVGDPGLHGGRLSGYGIETRFATWRGHHAYVPDSAPGIYPYVAWFKNRYPGLYELLDALVMDNWTPADAAEHFGVSESTISRYCTQAQDLYLSAVAEERQRKTAELRAWLSPTPVTPAPVADLAPASAPQQDGRLARGDRERQRIWDTLYSYERTHRQPPTKRELMDALGLSSDTQLRRHVAKLLDQGRLRKEPGARGLRVVLPD